MKTINFGSSYEDALKIARLAQRASKLAASYGLDYPVLTADMDLTACHCNGNPLDLDALAGFNNGDFGHDVFGIWQHINRKTGELQNCFVPRSSKPQAVVA